MIEKGKKRRTVMSAAGKRQCTVSSFFMLCNGRENIKKHARAECRARNTRGARTRAY